MLCLKPGAFWEIEKLSTLRKKNLRRVILFLILKKGWWFLSHNFISLSLKEKIPITHGMFHIKFWKSVKKRVITQIKKI